MTCGVASPEPEFHSARPSPSRNSSSPSTELEQAPLSISCPSAEPAQRHRPPCVCEPSDRVAPDARRTSSVPSSWQRADDIQALCSWGHRTATSSHGVLYAAGPPSLWVAPRRRVRPTDATSLSPSTSPGSSHCGRSRPHSHHARTAHRERGSELGGPSPPPLSHVSSRHASIGKSRLGSHRAHRADHVRGRAVA